MPFPYFTIMQRMLVILSLLVALLSRTSCCLAQELELECSPSHYKYDWERLNYYELLGLKYPASELDSKGIRKAYRQQAQLWHPDKNQNRTRADPEECTARFSRIADAYGVLNNADKRYEYDLFLQYCDEQGYNDNYDSTTRSSYRQKWSKLFENKIVDPLRVFEEFLFGGGYDREEGSNSHNKHHDQFRDSSFGSSSRRQQQQQQQQQHHEPIRISKHQETLQDPYTGEEIIRISQTEEYPPDPSSGRCCYYRILSQEFTKRFDPYTGLSLYPITEPYVRDEGYSSDPPPNTQSSSSSSSSPQPRQSLLFPGDILTPKSALLVSPNRRYYAGLSPECELIIMVDNTFGGDDDLIWSSETFGQNCFATIKGPHLVVAMGRPEHPHSILWYSNAREDDEDDYGLFQGASDQSTYLAQLDNDGSLVVYKVWSNPDTASSLSVATKVWMATRNFLLGNTRADAFGHGLTYKRCIYATGPLGCVRVARRLYQLSLDIYYTLKRVVSRIDAVFDAWMDLILEEDDYLHAFQESIWNGFGSQIANKSARLVRKVVEFVMLTTRGK